MKVQSQFCLSGAVYRILLVFSMWVTLPSRFVPLAIAQAGSDVPDLLVLDVRTVSSYLLRYSGTTGAFLGIFTTFPSDFSPATVYGPAITVGPDGNIYVAGGRKTATSGNMNILRFDGKTGQNIDTFANCQPSDLDCFANPSGGMIFGPDGNLYLGLAFITKAYGSVARFNGLTGALLGTFVPPDSGGMAVPWGIAFGPNGNFYVGSGNIINPRVGRYNGTSGQFIDTFIPSLGFVAPMGLVFGPDGNLYVPLGGSILRYNGTTGQYLDEIRTNNDQNPPVVEASTPIVFGPDGNFYLASHDSVYRYDTKTGKLSQLVASALGGLYNASALVFLSSSAPVIPTDIIFYPQLAVGGGYEVILLVNNKSDSNWKGTAKPLPNAGLDSLTTPITLKPKETQKLIFRGGSTTVSSGLQIFGDSGYPTSALALSYFFNFLDSRGLEDSTGVPKGQKAKKFTFPVERSASTDTGLAIRRLPGQPDSPITLTLLDANGARTGPISTGSNFAKFFTQFFTQVPPQFIGSIVAESQDDFYLVVIRLETTQTGFQLTSVPAEPN